jgi:hypothetical protein
MKNNFRTNCAMYPDVMSVGAGGDIGPVGVTLNGQISLAGNGRSGELSLVFQRQINEGIIGPDAYLFSGWNGVAPTNKDLNSSSPGGIDNSSWGFGRGGASLDNQGNMQVSFGPSIMPITAAAGSHAHTFVGPTVPYLGYFLNPQTAACTLLLRNK